MLDAEVHRQQLAILSSARLRRARLRAGNGDKVLDCYITLVIYIPAQQVKVARLTDPL